MVFIAIGSSLYLVRPSFVAILVQVLKSSNQVVAAKGVANQGE